MFDQTTARGRPYAISFDSSQVPVHPGCYLFKNRSGDVLYVGKAVNLRQRVSSYFRAAETPHRKAQMIQQIADMELILVRNEREALVLESQLIRKLNPRYNSRFTRKDDSYYYIALTDEMFPRLVSYRKRRVNFALQTGDCGVGLLFGPYTEWKTRNRLLDFMRSNYPLRTCHSLPDKACVRLDSEACLAPCIAATTAVEYHAVVASAVRFLRRPPQWRIDHWRKAMQEASDETDFARAAELRDLIRAVEHARLPQAMERTTRRSVDVLYSGENGVLALSFRSGEFRGIEGPLPIAHSPSGHLKFLEQRYAAGRPDRIVVNPGSQWRYARCVFPLYTPESARSLAGQMLHIAQLNQAFRTASMTPIN